MNRHVDPPAREGASLAREQAREEAFVQPAGSAARKAGFKAARRHSGRVRFLRWALPTGVVAAAGLSAAVAYFDPLSLAVNLPFDLGRVSFSGTRVKMEFPKLQGFTADNRGYSVTAESASQDLTNANRVDLEKIEARMELAEKGWATLSAHTGRYDTKSQEIVLDDGVTFSTDGGYGGKLATASIDAKGGKITSDKPVELTYLDGKLTADRMEIAQKDSRALFTGRVQLNFKLPPPGEGGKPAPASPAAVQ